MRTASTRLAVAVCALVAAAPAIAYVCHPDPRGTSSLRLRGHVVAYGLRGSTLTIALRSGGVCRTLVWRAGMQAEGSHASCASVAAGRRPLAAHGVRLVAAGRADRADRLEVLGTNGRAAHSWPLPVRVRPGSLQVSGGLAVFTARGGSGLWATRLADGRTAVVGPVRAGDRPLLDSTGVAYQDDVLKSAPANRPLLKFVRTQGIRRDLGRTGRALHTGGVIRAFSVDGHRAALVVSRAGRCDRVVFWDIAWRSVGQVSQDSGPTCNRLGGSGRITAVALGGSRAEWVTLNRGRPMLVAADGSNCQEWVIRRLSDLGRSVSLGGIAADGSTVAFALDDRSPGSTPADVGRVTGAYHGPVTFRVATAVRAVSAAGGRIAALGVDGSISVRTERGSRVRTLESRGATSLALGPSRLVTTGPGRLDVYSLATGRLLHRWALPRGAGRVDLQYGIAEVTVGRSVYAVDIASGRTARLAVAPVAVQAQIEPIGVVYAYSRGGLGTAKLVPMSRVEGALR